MRTIVFLVKCALVLANETPFRELTKGDNKIKSCEKDIWKTALSIIKHARTGSAASDILKGFRQSGILKYLSLPERAFECATGAARVSVLVAEYFERIGDGIRALRARQAASIFLSYDFQQKGQEWIEKSDWEISWLGTVEGVLRSMLWYTSMDTNRNKSMRELSGEIPQGKPRRTMKIAIVTVCDYDRTVTPLGELSVRNKRFYAKKNGYELIWFRKAPEYIDFFSSRMAIHSPRPPAWSKIDAMLLAMTDEAKDFDWIMWMDCDSFFMDMAERLEQVVELAEQNHMNATNVDSSVPSGTKVVVNSFKNWTSVNSPEVALAEFNKALKESVFTEMSNANCPQMNSSESDPIHTNCMLHVIGSEDGLMLNTGIFFVRKSVMSLYFLHRVRQLLFGKTAVTHHPWWEQTGIMQLISIPFTFGEDNLWTWVEGNKGFAPFVELLSQKLLNGYPPLIAGMLKTHACFEKGDFIVSFSGCKIYSSQSVCNHLFIDYFLQTNTGEVPALIHKFTE